MMLRQRESMRASLPGARLLARRALLGLVGLLGVGDQRRGVGQLRRAVQAGVLRLVANVELRRLRGRVLALVLGAGSAPAGVATHADLEDRRPRRDGDRDQITLQ